MSLINEQDKEGNTPMHLAANNGHIEIACLLRRRGTGVDLNATNRGGRLYCNGQCYVTNEVKTLPANGMPSLSYSAECSINILF